VRSRASLAFHEKCRRARSDRFSCFASASVRSGDSSDISEGKATGRATRVLIYLFTLESNFSRDRLQIVLMNAVHEDDPRVFSAALGSRRGRSLTNIRAEVESRGQEVAKGDDALVGDSLGNFTRGRIFTFQLARALITLLHAE